MPSSSSSRGSAAARVRFEFLTAAEAWVAEWDDTALAERKADRAREILAANREELLAMGAALRERLGVAVES
jgi:hypothetical protein